MRITCEHFTLKSINGYTCFRRIFLKMENFENILQAQAEFKLEIKLKMACQIYIDLNGAHHCDNVIRYSQRKYLDRYSA